MGKPKSKTSSGRRDRVSASPRREERRKKDYSGMTPQSEGRPLLIWGVNPVMELLERSHERIKKIILMKEAGTGKLREMVALAEKRGCPVILDTGFRDKSLDDAVHQGVAAFINPVRFISLAALLEKKEDDVPPFYLALDCLQDPHNLGAIIRSAAAAGVQGVILPKDRAVSVTATVYKVSAGAVETVPLCMVTNLVSALDTMKKDGIWVFGADGQAPRTLFQQDFTVPLCLVIGGEGKGLRPLVRRTCDSLVAIPLSRKVESLNAATAAAVFLFEVVRQRGADGSIVQP